MLPAGGRTTVTGVETFDGELERAFPPLSVAVRLSRRSRRRPRRPAELPGQPRPPPRASSTRPCAGWPTTPLRAGARYALKHTTRTVRATVRAVHSRVDMGTLEEEEAPGELGLNDIGAVTLRTSAPVIADAYADNRTTGAFVLIDERSNETVAAGMVRAARAGDAEPDRSPDVTWHDGGLDRDRRWDGARAARRDDLAHGPAGLGQVDDRRRARAAARGQRPRRLPARRRQRAPRPLRRPRLRRRRPHGEHPPGGPRRAVVRRLGRGGAGLARLPGRRRPRPGPAAARGRRPAVRGGARRHAARGVRAPRSEGPVRPRAGGRAARPDRRRRAVRGARRRPS